MMHSSYMKDIENFAKKLKIKIKWDLVVTHTPLIPAHGRQR